MSKRKLILSLLTTGLLAVAGCGRSPGETVRQFEKTEDVAAKKALMTKSSATANGKMLDFDAKFNAGLDSISKDRPKVDTVDIVSEKISGDSAVVEFKVHLTDGKTSAAGQSQLKKVDGEWRIQNMMVN